VRLKWLLLLGLWLVGVVFPVCGQQPAGTYNVKTDGTAQGNGVSDDTVAIQAALNNAKVQGKSVYFPSGNYLISGQIDVPNLTSVYGDKSGVSLIKCATPYVGFGEPDNDGTTVGDLAVEDMFFLNVSVYFTGYQKDRIAVRRCVMATDQVHSADWFLCTLSRGDGNTLEDNIFLAGHDSGNWPGTWIKGFTTYRNTRMHVYRNVFGLDLINLNWLTQWQGYAAWSNVQSRLQQFQSIASLPSKMGEFGGGIRLNECVDTVLDQNVFHFDHAACDVPQDATHLNVDHIIYATQATNVVMTRNWMRGHPPTVGGGLKHRDTAGPGVIAANYFDDTPLIVYSYSSSPNLGFDNQLIYNNYFKVYDFVSAGKPGGERFGIGFLSEDTLTGTNNTVDRNIIETSNEAGVPINLRQGTTPAWKIYQSNRFAGSSNVVAITGLAGPYTYAAGAPPTALTDPYKNLLLPLLNVPRYDEAPVTNHPPVFTGDQITRGDATNGIAYSGQTLAGTATDMDAGTTLTYSKVSGPAWLTVAGSGALSGTPGNSDMGTNSWTVLVSDGITNATATLKIVVVASGGGPVTVNFEPTDDTTAKQAFPTTIYGAETVMNTRNSATTEMNGYLKFNVQGVGGPVTGVKLRLYSLHDHTVSVHAVADTTWSEGSLVWNNKPIIGPVLASLAVTSNSMAEISLPASAVTTNGYVSFALKTGSASFRNFNTKEAGVNKPELEVIYNIMEGNVNEAPVISTVAGGGTFNFSFSGPAGQGYHVYSSTNVTVPISSWQMVTNGTFGVGAESYSESATDNQQKFFRVGSP